MCISKKYLWPLPGHHTDIPQSNDHPGSFGARRKYDVHSGVDLYAPQGQRVVAIENGVVVSVEPLFTGGEDTPKDPDGTPIWLPTAAVLVEGASGVIAYGEIQPAVTMQSGIAVKQGDEIGTILQVLKPKKNGQPFKNPANSPTMLHLELYKTGTRKTTYWQLDEQRPQDLLDPTPLLIDTLD